MAIITEILKQTKLLGGLTPEIIDNYIVPAGKLQNYEKDSYLILTGQRVDTVKIIMSGKVNVIYYFADGNYTLASTEFSPRVLALDLIATKAGISPYNAIAAEPTTIFSFPTSVILQPGTLPETERQVVLNQLLIMLSHLHMQKEKHLLILSRNRLRDRIMIYLSLQAQWKNTTCITIPFSREELAAYLCVNRSKLSHELSLMRKDGIIDFSKNKFTLLKYDPQAFTF